MRRGDNIKDRSVAAGFSGDPGLELEFHREMGLDLEFGV